jgi:multiple antibiotic resistance protein
VLLIALDMRHGSTSAQHHPGQTELADPDPAADVAVYPLTIPLLVGPGTIATLIVFGQTAAAQGRIPSLVVGVAGFLVLLGLSLFAAPAIGHHLSAKVTAITKRLMGMVLAAIAMEMMLASLQVFLKGVLH